MDSSLEHGMPSLPKRAFLPKERPQFFPEALEAAVKPSRFEDSLEILETLNRVPVITPALQEVQAEAPLKSLDKLSPKLFSVTLIVVTLLFFVSAATAFIWTSQEFQAFMAKPRESQKRRDLKENTLPDPSSPAVESSEPGDPSPALKQPSKPTRD